MIAIILYKTNTNFFFFIKEYYALLVVRSQLLFWRTKTRKKTQI